MYLTHLSLTNFRNFARLDIDVPRGPVMLVGANAQGKTSLLEAIFFLATFVSFHADNDRQLINFLAGRDTLAVGRIVADFCRSQRHGAPVQHRLEVRLIQESNGYNGSARLRKEVLLDGVKAKMSEMVGQFNAVLFLPQMLRIVEGGPDERRRYLNLALAQALPLYAGSLSDYTRVLSQRNALLKQLHERGGDSEQLAFWDEQLVNAGTHLIHARIHAVQELEQLASRFHRELTRGGEVLRLAYEPSYDPLPQPVRQYALPVDTPLDRSGLSLDKIRQGFLENLARLRGLEIERGVTTTGPHRDELRFLSNGIDLGTFGSRGQARTAVLSLKLAEVAWMKAKTGQWPVLLLDEVLAELDNQRRIDLLGRLLESEQVMLTTTDLDLFSPDFVQKANLWQIQAGRVEARGL
jgi:DNA replication and repair protein RecF